MRKTLFAIVMMLTTTVGKAQEINVAEPEFINSYCILTSDSTIATLPKESGTLGKHENKVSKLGKIIKGAATVASIGGLAGISTAGSIDGVITGARVMGTASSVASAAGTVSSLAGSSGMDVVFKGKHSPYTIKSKGTEVRLLIKGENNDKDPMDCYRIVRFKSSKKERRIQWMEFEPSLIGSEDTRNAGYVQFTGHKYGKQSYLITIPASEVEKGEYGIFYMSIITATTIPVGTFSVK